MPKLSGIIEIDSLPAGLQQIQKELGTTEYAIVKNPSYVYSPLEFYPLAPKISQPLDRIAAVVMDMDGTTTTTEPLCLHSLEYMVRKLTGRMYEAEWSGLDEEKDYPHIIGNSTTKHVEYLVDTYKKHLCADSLRKAFVEAFVKTFLFSQDRGRLEEVKKTLESVGLSGIWNSSPLKEYLAKNEIKEGQTDDSFTDTLHRDFGRRICIDSFEKIVRVSIDIYYSRYHEILKMIEQGRIERGGMPKEENIGSIQPMPGIAAYLCMLKGLVDEDDIFLHDMLVNNVMSKGLPVKPGSLQRFKKLVGYFRNNPVKIALVTSSIRYEAGIVMNEVFKNIRAQVMQWDMDKERKQVIANDFEDFEKFYHSIITASDSSEIRLKPHRDLYSLALHGMFVDKDDFRYCIGFEDSESGTIAIRSAGIGLCIAVPFTSTSGHNFDAASYVLHGGIQEAVINYGSFVRL